MKRKLVLLFIVLMLFNSCVDILFVIPVSATVAWPPTVNNPSPANESTGIGVPPPSFGITINSSANFTIVVLPDTQHYYYFPDGNNDIFLDETNWIVAHKDELNIVYVAHEGDIIDGPDWQWPLAEECMEKLEDPVTTGLTDGIPYSVLPGNAHDYSSLFNTYFGVSRFEERSYYGGHYGETNNNNYVIFNASGMSFIAISLPYDNPQIDWADTLLQTYNNRRGIVISHEIINTGGSWSGNGVAINNTLNHNPNLFIMLCGHHKGWAKRTDTVDGHTVHTVLADYSAFNGDTDTSGYLRIMQFCPATNEIKVQTYSPHLDTYQTDGNHQFTLEYDMSSATPDPMNITWQTNITGSWETFNTTTNVINGTYYAYNTSWVNAYNTKYYWRVLVNDGHEGWSNRTYFFTTQSTKPPTISSPYPANESTNIPTTTAFLSIRIDDPDNDTFNWTITTYPDIGSITKTAEYNGSKKCLLTDLSYSTTYHWYVNVTDGRSWTNHTYVFTTKSDDDIDPLLTYEGPYIDSWDIPSEVWLDYLDVFSQLQHSGFTHVGVGIWDIHPTPSQLSLILSRINDLRDRGFPLALHQSSAHRILSEELDPLVHPSNSQSIKFFDTPGFIPASPDSSCYRHAHDPAYNGTLWQQELEFLDNLTTWTSLGSNDVVLFDTELWGAHPSWFNSVTGCYPHVLEGSGGRYTSVSLDDLYTEYFNYWRQRGLDLKNHVKSASPESMVLFYGEQIPLHWDSTWMPVGTGDASSPDWYYAPNISRIQELLVSGDYSSSYIWLSFSCTDTTYNHPPGYNGGYTTAMWEPWISQRIGYLLREEGVKGIILYPGPYAHDIPIDYYLNHSRALADGFLNGTDVEPMGEICCDGWDNDGDGYFDEGCDCTNEAPIQEDPTPENGLDNVPVSTSMLSINVNDSEGDSFNWTIETFPDIGNASDIGVSNRTITCNISGLEYSTTYYWYVNTTDLGSGNWTNETYWFTTASPPSTDPPPGGGYSPPSENNPPTAHTGGPYQGLVNQTIRFNASKSSDDGTITRYNWTFGDGTNGTSILINHTYNRTGNYIVLLEVTDNYGLTDTDNTTATISNHQEEGTNQTNTTTSTSNDDDGDGLLNDVEGQLGSNSKNSSDVKEIRINNIIYYLVDIDGDGRSDIWYNATSGISTRIEIRGDETILIDDNGDGSWEYVYDSTTGATTAYSVTESRQPYEFPRAVVVIVGIGILIFVIGVVYSFKKKK